MDYKRVKDLKGVSGSNKVIHENILYVDTTKTLLKKALGEERMTRVFKLVDAQRQFVEMKMPIQSKTSNGSVAYAANSSLYRDEYDMDALEVTTNLEEADILVEVREGQYRMFTLNEASVSKEEVVETTPEPESEPQPQPQPQPETVVEQEATTEPEVALSESLHEYLLATLGKDNFELLENIKMVKVYDHKCIRRLKHPELQNYMFVVR